MSSSTRLDVLMAERGIAESRSRAQALIMAGRVLVEGAVVTKAGSPVPETARVELVAPPRYVSRGGEKLETALRAFAIDVDRRALPRRRRIHRRVHRLSAPARRGGRCRASTSAETSCTSGCAPTGG